VQVTGCVNLDSRYGESHFLPQSHQFGFINVGSGAINVGRRPRLESMIVSQDGCSMASLTLNYWASPKLVYIEPCMSEESENEVGAPAEASKAAINARAEVADACRDSVAKVLCDVAMAPLFGVHIGGIRREPVHLDLRMRPKIFFDDRRSMGIEPIPDHDQAAGNIVPKMAEGEHNILPTDRMLKVALIDTAREG
jgi:hypothetical protein